MPENDSVLLVQLETQDRAILNEVTSWAIDSDFLTTTDGFEFSCFSQTNPELVRGLELEPVELKVNGHSQVLGRVETSTMGHKGGEIRYTGRDYLSALVDCSIDPSVAIKEEMSLFDAFTTVTAPVGIDTVFSTGDLAMRNIRTGKSIAGGSGRDFKAFKAEEIKPNHGTPMMGYLSRIAARHGGTVQPANTRSAIMIAEPNYSQEVSGKLQRRLGSPDGNNVVRGVARRDFTRFPTYTMFTGSQAQKAKSSVPTHTHIGTGEDPGFDLTEIGPDHYKLVDGVFSSGSNSGGTGSKKGSGGKYDTATAATGFAPSAEEVILANCHIGRRLPKDGTGDPLKLYRLLAARDKTCRNQEQLDRLAVRQVGERLKGLLIYEVEVSGHVDPNTGAIWSVDTMIDVQDEECGIAEALWVARRRLSYSPTEGARTSMTLWRPGAFVT